MEDVCRGVGALEHNHSQPLPDGTGAGPQRREAGYPAEDAPMPISRQGARE